MPSRSDHPPGSVDEQIDTALRSYAEPPSTLGPRTAAASILQRARLSHPQRRRPLWFWIAPVPALTALLFAALWLLRTPPPPEIASAPPPPPLIAVPSAPTTPSPKLAASVQHTHHSAASRLRQHALPKQDVFPTPTPPSPQELALLSFVRHAPLSVQQAVVNNQPHWAGPSTTEPSWTQLPPLPSFPAQPETTLKETP